MDRNDFKLKLYVFLVDMFAHQFSSLSMNDCNLGDDGCAAIGDGLGK